MASLDLLDTPRRTSLKARSTSLRTSIKEWERSFAAKHDGRKPSKSDIKANLEIAAKYKEFQRLGDVLAGKLGLDALESPGKKQKADTVRRRLYDLTPRKPKTAVAELHPSQIDPYDAPPSATPKRFLSAIGPTPQRDGKVLGLFDLLSNSGESHGSRTTPGSQSKKRKVDALTETDANIVVQTPSRKRTAIEGDVLQHLAPANGICTSAGKKFERTPASESKKFMLSHFFATPSTMRYANIAGEVETTNIESTPLRSLVLGIASAEKQKDKPTDLHDITPVFLRRSHSFKERLTSAKPGIQQKSPSAIRRGPPTLRKYKSAPKPLSQIVRDLQSVEPQNSQEVMQQDGYDDDDAMDAMRELEDAVQVRETQPQELSDFEGQGESDLDDAKSVLKREKIWKKKGQKRTTKRSNMKPAMVKKAKAPKFVAVEESEDEISRVKDIQVRNIDCAASSPYKDLSDEELETFEHGMADKLPHGIESMEDEFQPDADHEVGEHLDNPAKKRRKAKLPAEKDELHPFKPKKTSRTATINPNAISHQNFKSLKIRGKSAKSTGAGGKGRFGRRK